MDFVLNHKRMKNLLENFYTIVKAAVGIFDLEGNGILSYPESVAGYCALIRSRKNGDSACIRCDRQAFQQAANMNGPYIYNCHAGLVEMVAPIITSEEKRIGYLMIGQVRQTENRDNEQWEDLRVRLRFPCSIINDLKIAYSKLQILKIDQTRACANILQCLANYVWLDNYISSLSEPLSGKVKGYISKNLDRPLSITEITDKFHIGKTKLCSSIKKDYNITVNELIRTLRIDKAKQLLQSDELPIYSVAEQVGIEDYNYFTKIFKDATGVTPSVFRKLCKSEYLSRTQQVS